ncbi:hypothetical protein JCM11641_004170 [Rhodosporidiobolus odoratus]
MSPDRTPHDPQHQLPASLPFPQPQAAQSSTQPQPPSLGRGRACDGRQPVCTPCEAAASRAGQESAIARCDFDTDKERRKPVGGGKVASLEAKIASLERRIVELTNADRPGSSSPSVMAFSPASPTPGPPTHYQPAQPFAYTPEHVYQPPGLPGTSSFNTLAAAAQHQYAASAFTPPFASSSAPFPYPQAQQRNSFPSPAPTFQMPPPIPAAPLYPPPPPQPSFSTPTLVGGARLPSWPTLRRLANVFFDYPHEAVDLINRKRFMQRFDLPPGDPDFPAQCLLHAMITTAADLIGEEAAFEGEERYWPEGTSPTLYHADQGDYLIPLGFRREKNLLQVAQAAVLFAANNLAHARFARSYLETCSAVRICVALGINHMSPSTPDLPLSSLMSIRTHLPPTTDHEELHERATTWWFAYTVEIIAGAATGWPCCMDERDVTTLLPSAAPYTANPIAHESLYLHSATFFTSNPPDLVRLVQINLKAVVLLGRVVTFVHRTTALAGATPDKGSLRHSDFPKIRASPVFQKLDAALEAFRRGAPNQLVTLLEPQAFLLPALAGACVILLHERFTTGEADCPSRAKCLEAANLMLRNTQVLNNASFHPRHIPPFLAFTSVVCGRALLREIALRKASGNPQDLEEVVKLRGSVQAIIETMQHSRTPLGPKSAASLVLLLDHPEITLPQPDPSSPGAPGVGAPSSLAQLLELIESRFGSIAQEMCS